MDEFEKAHPSEVSKIFRTEFINRIDDQIVFRVLNESDVGKILTTILDKISEDVKEKIASLCSQ